MTGSPGARRIVVVGALLLLTLGACGGGGDAVDLERFCEIDAELDLLDPFELPPDQARAAAATFKDLMDEGLKVAPDEIRAAVELRVDSANQILDLFEAADFDQTQIDDAEAEAVFEVALSDEVIASEADMDQFVTANCST